MFDLAHALDDLVETVLQVQEEAVPALRQGRHQTWNTSTHIIKPLNLNIIQSDLQWGK